jgi:hypothetical protein
MDFHPNPFDKEFNYAMSESLQPQVMSPVLRINNEKT